MTGRPRQTPAGPGAAGIVGGSAERLALAATAAFLLLRFALLFVPSFGLMPSGAYYLTYAEHLDLSYLDHPPAIGYLLFAAVHLFGKTAAGVRLGTLLTTAATLAAFYALARRLYRPRRARLCLGLFATTGMVTILSLMANPDVPLLLFWTLALLALHRAVFDGGRGWWLAAGLAMGLAFDSKYPAVYLQAGMLLFLLLSRPHRGLLKTPWPYLALAVAHLVSLPVYVWNLRHGLASFAFQTVDRAAGAGGVDLSRPLGVLVTQGAILLPFLLAAVLAAGWRYARRGLGRRALEPEVLFLLAFFLPLLLTCAALSLTTWVKTNWPMPAYVTGVLLAGRLARPRLLRRNLVASALLHAALVVQVAFYPLPVYSDNTWYGWKEMARKVEALAAHYPEAFVFSADHYRTTAQLRFHTELPVYAMNVLGWKALQYDYLDEDLSTLTGRDALLIRAEPRLAPSAGTERVLARVRESFTGVEELDPIRIESHGRLVRLFRVFLCRSYRGPPADDATPEG